MPTKKQLDLNLLTSIEVHRPWLVFGGKPRMLFTKFTSLVRVAAFCGACLVHSGALFAQAPAGPLPPSQPLPPPKPAPPPTKRPEVPARTTLAGFWKLNTEQSDDLQRKLEEARQTRAGSGGGPGGMPGGGGPGGNGRIGIGLPGQYPGSGGGGNGPWGGPGSGGGSGGDVSETTERMKELIRPEYSQLIDLGSAEVDSTNEHGDKVTFFTDGRKIQKSKNEPAQEVSAHWNGPQLVTEEKTPQGRRMSRTFELSSDGKQFYETWHIENGRSGSIIVIRYVYDAAMQD